MGACAQQTLDAFLEAEAHQGPSLVIAYGHCIAHGIDMRLGMRQQKLATDCGHWPLYRYRPAGNARASQEFLLDSQAPRIPLTAYAYNEIRYKISPPPIRRMPGRPSRLRRKTSISGGRHTET